MEQELVEFAASSRTGSCILHWPGHTVHIAQARRGSTEIAAPVHPKVEPDWGTVHFIVAGTPKLMWNHDAGRLSAALAASTGQVAWRPRNRCLAVPRIDESGLFRYTLFSLTPLEHAGLCRRTIEV
ncbi:hypothetical protein [Arthrobacter castelli]|uniref:hypothetical protein n=1 Tax=Arthrobacter castelli TaxID=271431 RepID=UPI000408C846|nr:hypothetical protein [Arthrobacter castelli]